MAKAPISAIWNRLENSVRLARAKHLHKTVRFKVGDLKRFYRSLNEAGISYVVLRWADEVPMAPTGPDAFEHDIDHLIDRGCIDEIKTIASRLPGPAKCDFYSLSGERGSAYRKFPYLPPALAQQVLENRVVDPRVFYIPAPKDMLFAFAFHLVYHKGQRSGLPSGIDDISTAPNAEREYQSELVRLAKLANVTLPDPLTLQSVHDLLRENEWNMPLDLMARWPDQQPILRALAAVETQRLSKLADQSHDINVFVLRSDISMQDSQMLVRKMIRDRFTILDDAPLSSAQVTRLARLTRGGNWYEKGRKEPVLPTQVIVCRNNKVPGPLPKGMSPEKVAARYPHLSSTDVLIKRDIRDAVNQLEGGPATRVILHATDNASEAAETLEALKGDQAVTYLEQLKASGR